MRAWILNEWNCIANSRRCGRVQDRGELNCVYNVDNNWRQVKVLLAPARPDNAFFWHQCACAMRVFCRGVLLSTSPHLLSGVVCCSTKVVATLFWFAPSPVSSSMRCNASCAAAWVGDLEWLRIAVSSATVASICRDVGCIDEAYRMTKNAALQPQFYDQWQWQCWTANFLSYDLKSLCVLSGKAVLTVNIRPPNQSNAREHI